MTEYQGATGTLAGCLGGEAAACGSDIVTRTRPGRVSAQWHGKVVGEG